MSAYDLEMFKRTEELMNRVYPRLKNYPKSEKFSLCQNIKNTFFELLKSISLANSVKSKRLYYAQEADGHLQILKAQIKLSKNQKYMSKGFFELVDYELTVINKLLVGYIRSGKNK